MPENSGNLNVVPTTLGPITIFKQQLGEGNLINCCMGSQEKHVGWLVGRIITIILRFWVGASKNKNIDH